MTPTRDDIDYDALLASTVRDIEIATLGRKDGLVTHTIEQAQSLVDAIRTLRDALEDAWGQEPMTECYSEANQGWLDCENPDCTNRQRTRYAAPVPAQPIEGCIWCVTKGGVTVCQPPRRDERFHAPAQPAVVPEIFPGTTDALAKLSIKPEE